MVRLLIVAALFVLPACHQVRSATYPPDFKYMEKEMVQTSMWTLARNAEAISIVMYETRESGELTEEQRADLLTYLGAMEKATATLTTDGVASNHPVIGGNIHRFRSDLQAAQAGARADPPNYYLAGTIAGSCQYCHKPRT